VHSQHESADGSNMNLGDIYFKTFAVIVAVSFLLALALTSLLRLRKFSWQVVVYAALPVWLVLGYLLLDAYHQSCFVAWHRWQNTALPNQGCLTYEPELHRLYATYDMDRSDFEAWVRSHPWQLGAGSNGLLHHDGPRLGFDAPELSFETAMAPNGQQLRVYFKAGIVYVSYNSL
jgi:hypothetical protein